MTDQTVPVPIDLLKRIVERTTPDAASDFRVPQELVSLALGREILALAALIPTPPKVGDELLASQTRELPFQTVLVDNEGDVWVSNGNGKFYMSVDGSEITANLGTVFEPYTLVYLPDRG